MYIIRKIFIADILYFYFSFFGQEFYPFFSFKKYETVTDLVEYANEEKNNLSMMKSIENVPGRSDMHLKGLLYDKLCLSCNLHNKKRGT